MSPALPSLILSTLQEYKSLQESEVICIKNKNDEQTLMKSAITEI